MFLNKILEKRKVIYLILVASLVLGLVVPFFYQNKKNVATANILFKSNNSQEEFVLTKNLFSTYKEIIKSNTTYQNLSSKLQFEYSEKDFNNDLKVIRNEDSNTVRIEVKNKESNKALEVLSKTIESFSKDLNNIYENTEVIYIENPYIERQINDRNAILIVLIFIILGIISSIVYVLISMVLEKKIHTLKEIESDIMLKPLCEIPLNKNKNQRLMNEENQNSKFLRAFDNLKTNIQFLNFNDDKKKTLLIVSPSKKEGKSYIAANLAVSYALAGKRVILIDADMNVGMQSKLFNVPNNLGFSNYLANLNENGIECNELINKYIKETSIKKLNIITSGTIPPNSQELLSNTKIEQLIKDLSVFFDIMIFDGTSVLDKTDSLILSRFVSATLLVSSRRKTKKEDLWKAKKDIQNVGGTILGVVLNRSKLKEVKKDSRVKNFIQYIKDKMKVIFTKKEIKLLPEGKKIEKEVEEIEEPIQQTIEEVREPEKINDINDIKEENDIPVPEESILPTPEEKSIKDDEVIVVDDYGIQQEITLDHENEEETEIKKEENIVDQAVLDAYLKDENILLIIVDAERAFCRMFGKNCFIEKPIKTISADKKGNKEYYTKDLIRNCYNKFRNTYALTEEQIKRVDILIYSILREYDDSLWTEKRIESYKAEAYTQIMASSYDRLLDETDEEYELRSKRLRKLALAKSNIDIEYKLDNLWKFNKMKLKDKFILQKYAKVAEIDFEDKTDFEIKKSKENLDFYNNIFEETNHFDDTVGKHSAEDSISISGELLNKIKEENMQEMIQSNPESEEMTEEVKEKHRQFKKEKERIDKIEKRKAKAEKEKEKRNKRREEKLRSQQLLREQREYEKEKQREEARIEEELLTDNLYPKTKFNKDL